MQLGTCAAEWMGDKPWVRGIDQTVSDKARLVHYSKKFVLVIQLKWGLRFRCEPFLFFLVSCSLRGLGRFGFGLATAVPSLRLDEHLVSWLTRSFPYRHSPKERFLFLLFLAYSDMQSGDAHERLAQANSNHLSACSLRQFNNAVSTYSIITNIEGFFFFH